MKKGLNIFRLLIISIMAFTFSALLIGCEMGSGSEKVNVRFEVEMPSIESGRFSYVIYGSFSNNKLKEENALTKSGDKYVITLTLTKGKDITYNYAILGSDANDLSHVELNLDKTAKSERTLSVSKDVTIQDKVERFKDIMLEEEVPVVMSILDDTFYDNDGGRVHTISYENEVLRVAYSKGASSSWSCIIRDFEKEISDSGKLDSITVKFKGEKNVAYMFKIEGGESPQEETVTGTGALQEYTMTVQEGARRSTKLVIFARPGVSGTNDNPIVGSYDIYSLEVTLKLQEEDAPYVPGENPIHILAIGNSFSDDALWLLYGILKDLGYDDIILANLYIGGCSVLNHKNNIINNSPSYTYRINKNGTWESKNNYKMEQGLSDQTWDFISLQQASDYSGLVDHYVADDIDYIYNYANSIASLNNPNVQFVWHMTWAYQQNSTHGAFVNYNKDQMVMYNGILNAVESVIENDVFNPIIVPNGTTIQNLRTTYIGDNVTRDGYHLNESYGRFAAALTFAYKLTGKDISNVKAASNMASKYLPLCIESAKNAVANPYQITESIYKIEDSNITIDFDNLTLLDQADYIIGNGYYNSQDSTRFLTPIQDGTDFCNGFITTKLFTRDDLPIGSVIVLESGYQYRPEGWINEAKQTSRNPNTTENLVLVDEEWWGNYIYRAFNLSKLGGGVLTGDAYLDALASFKIYIPKQ